MLTRFIRFLVVFNIFLVVGVIVFMHYGASQAGISDPTNASAWLTLVDWSLDLILFLFYLLLAALIIIFINYVRRTRE